MERDTLADIALINKILPQVDALLNSSMNATGWEYQEAIQDVRTLLYKMISEGLQGE